MHCYNCSILLLVTIADLLLSLTYNLNITMGMHVCIQKNSLETDPLWIRGYITTKEPEIHITAPFYG
jgi:hypothetical protein